MNLPTTTLHADSVAKRSKQARALWLLFIALVLVVLRPGIEAGLRLILAQKRASLAAHTFVIPRGWSVRQRKNEVQMWKPCMTIFCGSPTASIILADARAGGDFDAWRQAALETLGNRGYAQPNQKAVTAGETKFTCLESRSMSNARIVVSVCYDPALDIQATFDGTGDSLSSFYQLISN